MRIHAPLLVLAATLFLGACSSTTAKSTYHALESDLERSHGTGTFESGVQERTQRRIQWIHDAHDRGALNDPKEQYYAAGVLWRAQDPESLELAMALGHAAAGKGEVDALKFVAYATDRLAIMRGRLQRYGTQMVYETVHDRWKLYAYDRITTDAERAEMGVPPLAVMLANVEKRNQAKVELPFGEQ